MSISPLQFGALYVIKGDSSAEKLIEKIKRDNRAQREPTGVYELPADEVDDRPNPQTGVWDTLYYVFTGQQDFAQLSQFNLLSEMSGLADDASVEHQIEQDFGEDAEFDEIPEWFLYLHLISMLEQTPETPQEVSDFYERIEIDKLQNAGKYFTAEEIERQYPHFDTVEGRFFDKQA